MLRRIVTLATALALVACGDSAGPLTSMSAADPAPGTTETTDPPPEAAVAEPPAAAPAPTAPAPIAAAPAAPSAVAPVPVGPVPVGPVPVEPGPAEPAPVEPVAAPDPPAKRSPAEACAAVTAGGPAREIDLEAVRQALHGSDFRRGSFETVRSYQARVLPKLEAVEALAQATSGRPDLVFTVPIPAYRMIYDSDAHELAIGSELGLLRGGSAIGLGDFVLVSSAERQIGSHLGTVAFGAHATPQEIAKVRGEQLGVMLPGGSSSGWPGSFTRLHVAMTPAEAAAVRDNLAVLFVGKLQEPFFLTGEFMQEPRPGDPVDKRLLVEVIKVAVDCAAIYDRRTGRLIRQILPAPALAPAGAAG